MELASLRLICDQGKVLGVMPPQQARDEAAARGLLLLEVQSKAEPPIWKLVTTLPGRAAPVDETAPSGGGPESQERGSAGKAGKQSTKRPANKEARVKELRLVDKSADHDVATKMNFARGQLEKGRIVQVRVGMRVGMGMHMHMHMHMHVHMHVHMHMHMHNTHNTHMQGARTASQPRDTMSSTRVVPGALPYACPWHHPTVAASGTYGCRRGGSSARSRREQVRVVVRGRRAAAAAVRAAVRLLARVAPPLPSERGGARRQRVAARAARAGAREVHLEGYSYGLREGGPDSLKLR